MPLCFGGWGTNLCAFISINPALQPFIITEDEKLDVRSALFSVLPRLHPLHTGTGHRSPEHQPELRVLRAQPDGWTHARGRGVPGGGEETHSEPVTDEGQTQHHPPRPEGGDGDRAQEAPRREGARGREGGDPQPGRTRRVRERGGGGDVGDHQLRRDRCVRAFTRRYHHDKSALRIEFHRIVQLLRRRKSQCNSKMRLT